MFPKCGISPCSETITINTISIKKYWYFLDHGVECKLMEEFTKMTNFITNVNQICKLFFKNLIRTEELTSLVSLNVYIYVDMQALSFLCRPPCKRSKSTQITRMSFTQNFFNTLTWTGSSQKQHKSLKIKSTQSLAQLLYHDMSYDVQDL